MPTPTFSWCSIPTEQPKMPTVMSASGKTQQGGRQTGNVFLSLQMWLNTLNIQNISTLLWSIIYVFTNFHENPIIYNVLVILLYIKQTDKQADKTVSVKGAATIFVISWRCIRPLQGESVSGGRLCWGRMSWYRDSLLSCITLTEFVFDKTESDNNDYGMADHETTGLWSTRILLSAPREGSARTCAWFRRTVVDSSAFKSCVWTATRLARAGLMSDRNNTMRRVCRRLATSG